MEIIEPKGRKVVLTRQEVETAVHDYILTHSSHVPLEGMDNLDVTYDDEDDYMEVSVRIK
jgi:hypothetical protein